MKWIKAKWAEVSTKIGLMLAAVSSALPAYASVNPKLAYVGIAVSALLVLFDEGKGNGR